MASLCLEQSEIISLTGKRRFSAQRTALNSMGIEYHVRPDGSPAIIRSRLDAISAKSNEKNYEPDWDALEKLAGK